MGNQKFDVIYESNQSLPYSLLKKCEKKSFIDETSVQSISQESDQEVQICLRITPIEGKVASPTASFHEI